MTKKSKTKIGRVHVHVRKGMVETVEAEGLTEPIEVVVHDYDTQDERPDNTDIYEFKPESNERR